MEEFQEHLAKKERVRDLKFRRTFDRKPETHIKDNPRYNRTNNKVELQEEIDEYYEEKWDG